MATDKITVELNTDAVGARMAGAMVRSFGRELAIKVLVAALTDLSVVVFYDDTEARRSNSDLSPDTPFPTA